MTNLYCVSTNYYAVGTYYNSSIVNAYIVATIYLIVYFFNGTSCYLTICLHICLHAFLFTLWHIHRNCVPVCVQVQTFTARAWRHSAATSKHPSAWPPRATSSCCGGRPITAPTDEASTSDTWVSIKVCIQLITILSFFWCFFLNEKSRGDKNHGIKSQV